MNFVEFLRDNVILIIPNNIKSKVLLKIDELNKLYSIKIMSLEELVKKLTFCYDDKSIYYLMNKYNIKYEVAKVYLENIKYIENQEYDNKKLKKLTEIKKELIDNDLLIFDENFRNYIVNKEIIVYGYDYITNYQKSILNSLNNVSVVSKKYNNYKHKIYEFNNIDGEVEFTAQTIIDLINSGVDINNIKLAGISSEYYNVIDRIFNFYNIPINLPNDSTLYDTTIISCFLKSIKEYDIDVVLDSIKEKYDLNNDKNNYIYNKLINILNKYTFIDNYNKVLDMLIYDFKHTKNYKISKINCIEVVDLKNNLFGDNEYIFLLGLNQGNVPVIHKDEDYITDNLKTDINIELTKEMNNIEKEIIINIIKSIKNLIITYKLKTPFDVYYKSTIIDDLNFLIDDSNFLKSKGYPDL